jgi:hypothetical protein
MIDIFPTKCCLVLHDFLQKKKIQDAIFKSCDSKRREVVVVETE